MRGATRYLFVFAPIALFASSCNSGPDATPAPVFGLRSESHAVRVVLGDETFARIALGTTGPICITDLRAPGGQDILRGFPFDPRKGESVDHPEQTGIWMAHASVDGHDLWNGPGGIFATEHSLRVGRKGEAIVQARVEWRDGDGSVLCTEVRTYTFRNTPAARIVDIVHRIEANGGGLVLGDVTDGFFAMRFADAFRIRDGSSAARSFSSKGARNRELRGLPARWMANVAEFVGADGMSDHVTVCILDHPRNVQHPPIWNARTYGLVAANPFARTAFTDDDTVVGDGAPGTYLLDGYKTLTMRYRIVVAPTVLDYNDVDVLWTGFAAEE